MRYALALGIVLALIASRADAAPASQPTKTPVTIYYCASTTGTPCSADNAPVLRYPIMRRVTRAPCSGPCSNVQPVEIPEDLKPFVGPTMIDCNPHRPDT